MIVSFLQFYLCILYRTLPYQPHRTHLKGRVFLFLKYFTRFYLKNQSLNEKFQKVKLSLINCKDNAKKNKYSFKIFFI